jgi:ABC transporter substrate binding protein
MIDERVECGGGSSLHWLVGRRRGRLLHARNSCVCASLDPSLHADGDRKVSSPSILRRIAGPRLRRREQLGHRSALGCVDRFPPTVWANLRSNAVSQTPELLVTATWWMVELLKQETNTIPIVAMVNDPVAAGLADSLARPGGNVTGVVVDAGMGP